MELLTDNGAISTAPVEPINTPIVDVAGIIFNDISNIGCLSIFHISRAP